MNRFAFLFRFGYVLNAAVYEVSDLINISKRSGTLQERFFKQRFMSEARDDDFIISAKYLLAQPSEIMGVSQYLPVMRLSVDAVNIDDFTVRTAGGPFSVSFRQAFSSVTIQMPTIIRDAKGNDVLRIDATFLGNYAGLTHRIHISNVGGAVVTAGEVVGTELYDSLYGIQFLTPWFKAHGGYIQNIEATNLHLSTEGRSIDGRFFFGGSVWDLVYLDCRIRNSGFEYLDAAFSLKRLFSMLSMPLPLLTAWVFGVAGNSFAGIGDSDIRIYANPQVGFPPYAVLRTYIEWQPNAERFNANQWRGGEAELSLCLPMFISFGSLMGGTNMPAGFMLHHDTNRMYTHLLIRLGVNGGVSFYNDPSLLDFGAASATAFGYYIGVNVSFGFLFFQLTAEYRVARDHRTDLCRYIESFGKPNNQLFVRFSL